MPDERKRQTLPPERLRVVLARLNEVLAEAQQLRDDITRQLDAQHHVQQQHLAGVKGKKSKATRARAARGRRTAD